MLTLFGMLGGSHAWAESKTVTYKVTSTSAVSTSGTAPTGSSATYASTYDTKSQLTSGNTMTLTLSGFAGMKLTGLTLSMKSNKNKGSGYLDVKAGKTQLATIGSKTSGVPFKNAPWHDSYTTDYVNVNVTLTPYTVQAGENIVIIIGATVNSLYCQSFTLTYEEGASTPLANRNLAFSASAVDAFGSSVDAPTLTGHTDGVTYESSDPEVASVDANTGAVTVGTKFGTTTIKASAAEDANYNAGEASYALSVWPTSIAGLKTLITSNTAVDFKVQLNNAIITYVDGKNVYLQDADAGILIYLNSHTLTAGKSYTGVASGQAKVYNGLREITSIDWGTIAPVDASVPAALEVTVAELQADYDQYENMYVCVKDATVTSALASRNATIAQGEGDAQKEYAVYDKNNGLSSTALSNVHAIASVCGFPGAFNTTYQLNVYSAAAVEETGYNLAVSAAGYATYFNSTKAYTLPAGVKGHIWDLSNALVNTYAPGSVVPANEPLVIEATEGNYALMFTTTEQQPVVNNTLKGTDEATDLTDDSNYYYYGLSLNASSELSSVGFYWMNPTGAAFKNGAHKAYLKLAKSTFSPSMVMSAFPFNGSATGIDHIATGADTTKPVFQLSGRRVNKAIKGIYIVNGKKVLVK